MKEKRKRERCFCIDYIYWKRWKEGGSSSRKMEGKRRQRDGRESRWSAKWRKGRKSNRKKSSNKGKVKMTGVERRN